MLANNKISEFKVKQVHSLRRGTLITKNDSPKQQKMKTFIQQDNMYKKPE